MPAHYRTKSRTFPKTYLPSREPGLQILILVWWADCYPALSTPRAKTGLFNGALLVSIMRFSYFTTAPLGWRLSFLPSFEPHLEIPSAIFTNNDLPFLGGTAGVPRKS